MEQKRGKTTECLSVVVRHLKDLFAGEVAHVELGMVLPNVFLHLLHELVVGAGFDDLAARAVDRLPDSSLTRDVVGSGW
jgi:hypothetical protein